MIYLGEVEELQRLEIGAEAIEIGAAVAYDRAAPGARRRTYPDFGELLRRLGSTQIRNAGTIGGNIANGSPIGDSPPALIALGARLVLCARAPSGARSRWRISSSPTASRIARRASSSSPIRLPRRDPGRRFACYKISKRFDQDISACSAPSI